MGFNFRALMTQHPSCKLQLCGILASHDWHAKFYSDVEVVPFGTFLEVYDITLLLGPS